MAQKTQDEVLTWGVPGRLDTELTLLALTLFAHSLSQAFSFFVFPSLKWPVRAQNTKLQLNVKAGIFPFLPFLHWRVNRFL